MKSAHELFQQLPPEIRDQAISNAKAQKDHPNKAAYYKTVGSAISNEFGWSKTPQGTDYWHSIWKRAADGEFDSPPIVQHAVAESISPPNLTKREYFAGMALTGMLADPNMVGRYDRIAEDAVRYADALLKELSNPTT